MRNRQSIRLKDYDYSKFGYYYITICAQDRELYFENNEAARFINQHWCNLKNKFANIDLDEYVIMPNHLHGIIVILDDNNMGDHKGRPYRKNYVKNNFVGAGLVPARPGLGNIIGAFKSITTHKYIQNTKTKNWPWFAGRLWQRNYYERIIRNQKELNKIRLYIQNNPINWEKDRNNPKNFGGVA